MSILRQKMIADTQLRGLAARTQEVYLLAVKQLAAYYRRSPDELGEAELHQYFLYLINERKRACVSPTHPVKNGRPLYQSFPPFFTCQCVMIKLLGNSGHLVMAYFGTMCIVFPRS